MLEKPKFTWNDETVAMLRREVASGYSATQISNEFARYYSAPPSRNAVIGKAHRLGLTLGGGTSSSPRNAAGQPAPAPRAATPRRVQPAPQRPAPRLVEPPPPPLIQIEHTATHHETTGLVTLMGLKASMCRYPVGEPDPDHGQLFCGAATDEPTDSYCPKCYAITHTRQVKRTPAQIEADESRRRLGRLRNPAGKQWTRRYAHAG